MNTYGQHIRQEDGRNELYPFDYIEYYEAKVKPRNTYIADNGEEKTLYDGLTFDEFQNHHKEGFLYIIKPVLEDQRLNDLQAALEKEGKQVCMFNMMMLSIFLFERIKSKYAILLKPTIEETLAALTDVKTITFTNSDGSMVESSSKELIIKLIETIEANKTIKKYEVEKMVTWDEISNKSLSQCFFVHELSAFLSSYFPLKRKKNAKISTTEVELILYMMKLTGISKEELTNKRYWQLLNLYERIMPHVVTTNDTCNFNLGDKSLTIQMFFLPYSVWSEGKIDWSTTDIPQVVMDKGTIIQF